MKAVIYARYSSDNQREESIEGQLRECTAFAEKNGITILRSYIDRAFSAKTDNRPQFQEMIRDSSKKLFDMVIIWKLDRFARNRYDSARYKALLKKNGVKVVSATEIISSGAEGIILESVLEGYAEYFSADLAEKVSRGMTENALKCKFNGGNPTVGYQIDNDQCFQINPLTAPHVLEAFKLYDEGATIKEVRDYLNEHGVQNTRGQAMTYNSVSQMLRNRRYIGEYKYRDITVPNGIPAIVPEDLFERVQQRIEKNRKAPARFKAEEDYLLTTKLFCGHCGAYLCGESGTSHTGVIHRYYKCVSVKKKRTDCKKKPVRKQWIEDLVIRATMDMLSDDATIEAIIATVLDLLDRENINLPLYEQQLREVETGIENLLNAMQQGILTKSTKARLEELETTKEDLEIKILNEKLAKPKIEPEFLRMYLLKFRQLERDNEEHRKLLVDTFINAIFLYDDKLVITFNYRDGSKTITLRDINETIFRENLGSDIECCAVPKIPDTPMGHLEFFILRRKASKGRPDRRATAGSKEARELEKLKHTFEKVYRETKAQTPDGTQYSLSNGSKKEAQTSITYNFKNTVDSVLSGTYNGSSSVLIGYTPDIMLELGVPSLPVVIGTGHIYSTVKTEAEAKKDGRYNRRNHYHGLDKEVLKNIYEKLCNPEMVIASKDVGNNFPVRSIRSVVAIVDVGTNGNSLLLPVELTVERQVDGMTMDVNVLSSAYHKNVDGLIQEAIAQENAGDIGVFYIKNKTAGAVAFKGLIPKAAYRTSVSGIILHQIPEKVNLKIQDQTQTRQFLEWFGDWQNNPSRASKVVNSDGTPKIMYRGDSNSFAVFDRSKTKYPNGHLEFFILRRKASKGRPDRRATAGSKEARMLEKLKHTFEKVYRETKAQTPDGTKYSIAKTQNMSWSDQLVQAENGRMNGSNSLYIGKPSNQLQTAGFSDAPFVMNQSDYRKSRRESGNNKHYSSHSVPYDFFENMPKYLADAPMLIDNGVKVTVITSYGMKDTNGNDSFVIAGVLQNQKMNNDTVNLVKSVYPLDDFAERIRKNADNGKLIVINKNKAEQMLATIGVQPSELSSLISLARGSLSQRNTDVKTQFSLSNSNTDAKGTAKGLLDAPVNVAALPTKRTARVTKKAFGSVVGHEIAHVLEGSDLYKPLTEIAFKLAKEKGEYNARTKALQGLYGTTDVSKELAADLIGDYLFRDEAFVRALSTENLSLFKKVWNEVKHLYKLATAGSKEARELEKLKHTFEKVYREGAQSVEGTKYSLNIMHTNGSVEALEDARYLTNADAVKYLKQAKSGELQRSTYIPVRNDTPQVIIDTLEQVNEFVENRPLVMQVQKAQQAMAPKRENNNRGGNKRGHSLTSEQIVEILNNLDEPSFAVYQTNRAGNDGNSLPNNAVFFVEYNKDGAEAVAVIEFDSQIDPKSIGTESGETKYHTVVTVFEPDTMRNGAEYDYAEELLSNPNNTMLEIVKKQSARSATGERSPNTSSKLLSNDNVTQNDPDVKTQFSLSNSNTDAKGTAKGILDTPVNVAALPTKRTPNASPALP